MHRSLTRRPGAMAARIAALAATLALVAPGRSAAQTTDCTRARDILAHVQAGSASWALGVIGDCGALGGRTLAAVLDEHRADATPAALEPVVAAASMVTDRTLYERALDIATDASAGVAARVQAIRVIYHQLNPSEFAPYETFTTPPGLNSTLRLSSVSGTFPSQGDSLPANVHSVVNNVMKLLAASTTAPVNVRSAAVVLRHAAEVEVLRARLCAAATSRAECEERIDDYYQQHP